METRLRQLYQQHFSGEPILVRSPGRINLIGEHTDYNMGFVLPAAVQQAAYIALGPRSDDQIHLYAADFGESHRTTLSGLQPSAARWPDYLCGVAAMLRRRGMPLRGFQAVLTSDIPIGSGMSSSAAVECAVLFALNEAFGLELDRLDMVRIAQEAENEFVGVRCGIMDQFASMMGRAGSVIRLDCRSLAYEYLPFGDPDFQLVLFDSGVKHSLAETEYNVRRAECEQGVRLLQRHDPAVRSLRDASVDLVTRLLADAPGRIFDRCLYVTQEIQRLNQACEDLRRGDLSAFGQKMFATHDGLSRLYEVSCPELDFLVDAVREDPAVLGSRLMGGGFGGCTINLVRTQAVEELCGRVGTWYRERFGRPLPAYPCRLSPGTSRLG
ncbi:MAG TPA: galactokinase [Chitinophagaceae bacterium]|nr:galactokinase [Chitinophagaceae bacterium]